MKRKPQRIATCLMGDFGHFDMPRPGIWATLIVIKSAWVFYLAGLLPPHEFIVLTKRPANLADYLEAFYKKHPEYQPLPNLTIGVSIANQTMFDQRISGLLSLPAARRIISFEPLLGEINFRLLEENKTGVKIDGVIVGGESGPNARPMHPHWINDIYAWTLRNPTHPRFYFKQWGTWGLEHAPGKRVDRLVILPNGETRVCDEGWEKLHGQWVRMFKNGARNSGAEYLGYIWDQWPDWEPEKYKESREV
jgi:protein gp37